VRRGFTLVELMVSVVIIALLAAMATPSFVAMMRDRRVVRAGLLLADTYREARSRTLSRGIAVMVRWRAGAGGKGTIEMREAVVAPGQGVAATCQSVGAWTTGSVVTREISSFDFAGPTYELANLLFLTESNASTPFADICFSPNGVTCATYLENGVCNRLAGVPRFDVTNTLTTMKRTVFIPPNGVARLQL